MIGLFHTVLLFLFFENASTLEISIPLFASSNVLTVSRSLVSFSIEQDRWIDWAGDHSRNEFFFNTLDNLKQLSGESPRIRIGANSEDRTIYDSSVQFSEAIFPASSANTPYPEATNVSVGDAFFATAQFLPSDTRVIWGLNLGNLNFTATVLQAKALVKAFSSPNITDAGILLEAIEIGNEADLYVATGVREKGYEVDDYVKQWLSFAGNVTTAMNPSSPHFWGGSFAGSSKSTTGFSPQGIIDKGILSDAGSHITTISQHRYSGSFCVGTSGLLTELMSKDSIRGNLSEFISDIKAVRSKNLDYVLGETNSYACHGAPGVSNTAGAALWTLDYLFFASQIEISRVYLHQGIGFKYNLVQPSVLYISPLDGTTLTPPMAPHIQPSYYAAIIAAEALGPVKPDSAAGGVPTTRVHELTIGDQRVTAYAFYRATDGAISKLLLINLHAYFKNATPDISRGKVHIDLRFLETPVNSTVVAPQNMTIKRLAIENANDTAGITWGGQTYETDNGRVSGDLKVEESAVKGGFDLYDTEAVLVYFD